MTQTSYPKGAAAEEPLGEDQWKSLFLPMGRGIVDMGGNPYWLSNKDSVNNTVTIGVDNIHGFNSAILDGFLHYMDAPETISLPAVTTDTTYEIGLVYDPLEHDNADQGPIRLTAWTDPEDTTGGRSYLTLWRLTRKANLSLANTPHAEVRPRASGVSMVTRYEDLPTDSLVLSDMLMGVRSENAIYRSAVASGNVQWIKFIGGGSSDVDEATHLVEPGKLVRRWDGNGTVHMPDPLAPSDAANKRYVDGKATWDEIANKPSSYWPSVHSHTAAVIESGEFDNARVKGSTKAYSNTNVGSTWASVVATTSGSFGRYPSALKFKKNIREWDIDPEVIINMTPVKYDLRTEIAGEAPDDSSNQGLIGFVADSYVNSLRELVEKNGDEVEGFKYMLMPVAQQVVLRWHEDRVKSLEAENDVLRHNLTEVLALLGLNTDDTGRVITTDGTN